LAINYLPSHDLWNAILFTPQACKKRQNSNQDTGFGGLILAAASSKRPRAWCDAASTAAPSTTRRFLEIEFLLPTNRLQWSKKDVMPDR
jgi:hypothetical protein